MRLPSLYLKNRPPRDFLDNLTNRPSDASDVPSIKVQQYGIPNRFRSLLESEYQHAFESLEYDGVMITADRQRELYRDLNFENERTIIINYRERESAERLMCDIACRAAKSSKDIRFHWIGTQSCMIDGGVWDTDDCRTGTKHIIAVGPFSEKSKKLEHEIQQFNDEFISVFGNELLIVILMKSSSPQDIVDQLEIRTEILFLNLGRSPQSSRLSV